MKTLPLLICVFYIAQRCSAETERQQRASLAGEVTMLALRLDCYNNYSFPSEFWTYPFFDGARQQVLKHANIDLADFLRSASEKYGRDIKAEARKLVEGDVKSFGGVESEGMRKLVIQQTELLGIKLEAIKSISIRRK